MNARKTDAELRALLRDAPAPGTFWRHYRGGRYFVKESLLLEADCTVYVVYAHLGGGTTWARPAAEWSELVEHEGRMVPRFTPES